MITKERLEELIEHGATIYTPDDVWQTIGEIYLEKKCYISEDDRLRNEKITYEDLPNATAMYSIPLEDLFETKEDAKFDLRFKRIPRTEYLDLPTWEEFTKERDMEEFGFYSKYHKYTTLKVISDKYLAVEDNWERYYTSELTEENYIKACEMCRKLWLGE